MDRREARRGCFILEMETNSRKDDLFRGAVLVLHRPGYCQALRRGAYPVPWIHEHAFYAGVCAPRPPLLLPLGRAVGRGVAVGTFGCGGSIERASILCCCGECACVKRKSGSYSRGP